MRVAQPSVSLVVDGSSWKHLAGRGLVLRASLIERLGRSGPLRDTPGLFKTALIEDPWGVKIEVVQDPKVLGFHHVHLQVPDPEAS